jgi:hypothetical protein
LLAVPRRGGRGGAGPPTPLVALVLAHARQGLVPVEVRGEVEWLLNRTDKGWLVALLNPAGNQKLQHGVGPTDYSRERSVTLRTSREVSRATEWFGGATLDVAKEGGQAVIPIVVPAGDVRIVELRSEGDAR